MGGSRMDLLQTISTALGPAAMVSATALLTVGVSQKHGALADRLRGLMAELRSDTIGPARRSSVQAQIRLFHVRIHLVARAHRALYLAVCAFLVMVLVTATQPIRLWQQLDAGMFLFGMCLTIAAVVLEFLELRLADRTIHEETKEALIEEDRG